MPEEGFLGLLCHELTTTAPELDAIEDELLLFFPFPLAMELSRGKCSRPELTKLR
jgi:hypothetical protein